MSRLGLVIDIGLLGFVRLAAMCMIHSAVLGQLIHTDQRITFDYPEVFDANPYKGDIAQVIEDERGFVWFATDFGLMRFDGNHFKAIHASFSDSTALANRKILDIAILRDHQDKLIIATPMGLNSMDLNSGLIKRYLHHQPVGGHWVEDIYEDRQGNCWITTASNGVWLFHPDLDSFELAAFDERPELGLSSNAFEILQDKDDDDKYWIATDQGLLLWDRGANAFTQFQHPVGPRHKVKDIIYKVYQRPDGQILTGNYRGLSSWSPEDGYLEHFIPSDSIVQLFGISVYDIQYWSPQEVLLRFATGSGIYNLRSKAFTGFWKDEPNNRYFKVVIDQKNYAWANSPAGLFRYDLRPTKTAYYSPAEWDMRSRPFDTRKILEDPIDGTLCICHTKLHDGLLTFDRESETWQKIPLQDDKTADNQECLDMFSLPNGEIIVVGTRSIYRLPRHRANLERIHINTGEQKPYFTQGVVGADGKLWIGTKKSGLLRMHPDSGLVSWYIDELNNPGGTMEHFGQSFVYKDSRDFIWVRGRRGYSYYDPNEDTFYNFHYRSTSQAAFLHHENFAEDYFGRIWLAGGEFGLGLIEAGDHSMGMDTFILQDRFPQIWVARVDRGPRGNMWLSTSAGRMIIDPKTFASRTIPPAQLKPFYTDIAILSDGHIAVGYANEIGILNPDDLFGAARDFQPFVDEVLVAGSSLPFQHPNAKSLDLAYDENFVSFRFGVKYHGDLDNLDVQYRLVGAHDEWTHALEDMSASYSSLRPGRYTFEVKVSLREDPQLSEVSVVNLRINPPWWARAESYLLYALLLGIGIYFGMRYYFRWRLARQEAVQLRGLSRLRTEMFENITHELKTPLTVIIGQARELLQKPAAASEAQEIERGSTQLLETVNQILELEKLELGELEVSYVQGNVSDFVRYQVASFEAWAQSKHIRLTFSSDPDPLLVQFDQTKVRYILQNLISNALKFTPDYGKIDVRLRRDRQKLILDVRDTGIGISAEEKDLIFERYYQVVGGQGRERGGSGIGLSLVRKLVDLLEGSIKLESSIGSGSQFQVILPFKPIDEADATAPLLGDTMTPASPVKFPNVTQLSGDHSRQKGKLLVLEDNRDVADYIRSILQRDFELTFAFNGVQGLQALEHFSADVILSDLLMPEMDGIEFTRQLRSNLRTSHIPVIVLTAKSSQRELEEVLMAGADVVLEKPFEKTELLIRIEQLMVRNQRLKDKFTSSTLISDQKHMLEQDQLFVARALRVIEDNLSDEHFNVHELARRMALSRSQLHRKIKDTTGYTSGEWIKNVRLYKARSLLWYSELNVSEVSYEVGFKDPSYFTKVYQQLFGTLPSEERRSIGQSF